MDGYVELVLRNNKSNAFYQRPTYFYNFACRIIIIIIIFYANSV